MVLSLRIRNWISEKRTNLEPRRAWVTLFSAFMTYFIVGHNTATFGLIYKDLIDKYDSNRSDVGWSISIQWISMSCSCIFMNPLIRIFGHRRVTFVSGFLFGAAITLSALAPNLVVFCLLYGLLNGVACAGAYTASTGIIQQVFTHNRGLANGIVTSGVSIGQIVDALYTRQLLKEYGLFGTLILQGAISLNIMVCGLGFSHYTENKSKNKSVKIYTISKSAPTVKKQKDRKTVGHVILKFCREIFDVSILKNAKFTLFVLHFAFGYMTRIAISANIVGAAVMKGIPEYDAALLLSTAGIGTLASPLFSAVIMNFSWFNPFIYTSCAVMCAIASSFIAVSGSTFAVFTVSAILNGFFDGMIISNLAGSVVHILGKDNFNKGFSIIWLLTAPFLLIITPLVGWLVDITGGYTVGFTVLGAAGMVSMLLSTTIFILVKCRHEIENNVAAIETIVISENENEKVAANESARIDQQKQKTIHIPSETVDTSL